MLVPIWELCSVDVWQHFKIGVIVDGNNGHASKPLPSLALIPDLSNKSAVKSKNGPATLPLGSGMCNVSPAYLCHEVF